LRLGVGKADKSNAKARFKMTTAVPISKTTHIITLESDGESSISKFNIHDADGNILWSGITLYGPFETKPGFWSGLSLKSLSAIIQKLWLVDKIEAGKIEENAIRFSLNMDAQYELPLDTEKYVVSDHSELSVMLWRSETLNDQEEENTGISTGACRRPVRSVRLGEGEAPRMVGRARGA
jgi:hypothetical protein